MESRIIDQTEVPFPALTICPEVNNSNDSSTIWDLISELQIRWTQADEEGSFRAILTQSSSGPVKLNFQEQNHYKYGKCFTFAPPPEFLTRPIYYYKLY